MIRDEPLLEVRDLGKDYGGVRALQQVSFDVRRGEILGLIGPNGAGKTTLFNALTGLAGRTTGGAVLRPGGGLRDRDLTRLRPDRVVRAGVARTFQNIRLFAGLSALDNVRLGAHAVTRSGGVRAVLRTAGFRREEERLSRRAVQLLDHVGLAGREGEAAGDLPYGDQRRLEIARALAAEPVLVLLDEPAAGMNPAETRSLMDLVRTVRDDGVTVILIEHDMRLVMGLCDRVVVLDHGECIARGAPEDIQRDPVVLEAYLGRAGADDAEAHRREREGGS